MSDSSVVVLVPSFDGYRDVWEPFFRCLFKYWPDCPYSITLGSIEATYADPRVAPLTIGCDRDYSSNLLAMLGRLQHDWVLLWIDDLLLSRRVDTARVVRLFETAQRHGAGVVRLNNAVPYVAPLFSTRGPAAELDEMPKGAPYRVSIGLSLWRRDLLMRLLVPGESAWSIERAGTLRSNDAPDRFFCLARRGAREPLFDIVNGVRRGRWTREARRLLRREGMGRLLESRAVENRRFTAYMAAYSYAYYAAFQVLHTLAGRHFRTLAAAAIARRGGT